MSDPNAPAAAQPVDVPAAPQPPVASAPAVAEPVGPPAVPGEPAPAAYAAAPAKKRRGLGIWSFVLALFAVIGDIIVVVAFFATLGSVLQDPGNALGGAFGFLALAAIVYFGGYVVAGLALLLGIIGVIVGHGRVLSVFGIILSLGVIVTHIAIGGGFSGLTDAIGGGIPGLGG